MRGPRQLRTTIQFFHGAPCAHLCCPLCCSASFPVARLRPPRQTRPAPARAGAVAHTWPCAGKARVIEAPDGHGSVGQPARQRGRAGTSSSRAAMRWMPRWPSALPWRWSTPKPETSAAADSWSFVIAGWQVQTLDYRETAPSRASRDMYLLRRTGGECDGPSVRRCARRGRRA